MPDGGVYALTLESGPAVGFAIPVQPIVKNGTVGLMHIARAGEWKGHPSGAFEFTADLFDALVERFNARGTQALLVDYFHDSVDATAAEPEKAKAGGWIRSLWRAGEGLAAELWAVVEFTQRAATMITAGELLFCSPVVAWEVPDTRTGKAGPELLSAALTNQPFQDHLKAIALSRALVALAAPPPPKAKEGDDEEPPPADGEEEPQQGDAPPAEGDAPATEEPPAPVDGNTPPADAEGPADPLMSLATQLGVDRATVCACLEANMDVFAKAIGDALEKQRKEQPMATPQTQAPAQPTQLARDVEDLKKQLADERAARVKEGEERKAEAVALRVDGLIADGYGTQDMRDYMIFEFSRDAEKAAEKFSEKVVPVGDTQAGNRDQVKQKAKLAELSGEERTWHDAVTKARLMSSAEALNRIIARREAAGKAA